MISPSFISLPFSFRNEFGKGFFFNSFTKFLNSQKVILSKLFVSQNSLSRDTFAWRDSIYRGILFFDNVKFNSGTPKITPPPNDINDSITKPPASSSI